MRRRRRLLLVLPVALTAASLASAAPPTGLAPGKAKGFGFLDRWVVGNRTLGHEVLKEKALQSSPDFDSKVDAVVIGPDRVEGTVYTKGVQESLGEKIEYRISFSAAVKPRASGR